MTVENPPLNPGFRQASVRLPSETHPGQARTPPTQTPPNKAIGGRIPQKRKHANGPASPLRFVRLSSDNRQTEFMVVFHRRGQTTHGTTQKTTQKILNEIRHNPHITRKELAVKVGINIPHPSGCGMSSRVENPYGSSATSLSQYVDPRITEDGVKFSLNQLKRKKTLRRVGPDKGGSWEIVPKKSLKK